VNRAKLAETNRVTRFDECQRILAEADWPGELIDVEPLLDGETVVLHVAAFEEFDEGVLRARFRVMCDLEVVFEPIGSEMPVEEPAPKAGSCGSCSSGGGCSTGGCGTKAKSAPAGKSSTKTSGCETCALSRVSAGGSRRMEAGAGVSE
jgi:hypothetical protein